jgi:hypothetical protein
VSKLIHALAPRIIADQSLINLIQQLAREQLELINTPDPEKLRVRQREMKAISEDIRFILEYPGDTDTDRRESGERLKQLRAQRSSLERQIAEFEALAKRAKVRPADLSLIEKIVGDIAGVLQRAASGETAAAIEFRRVLLALTGGKIEMTQAGEAMRGRGYLRGSFKLQLVDSVLQRAGCSIGAKTEATDERIVVDFVRPNVEEKRSERVKRLWDEGKLMVEIAKEMRIHPSRATKALRYWFESRGQKAPDGRGRWSKLERKHSRPPRCQEIAPEVLRLYKQNVALGTIAKQTGVDHRTVDSSLKWQAKQTGFQLKDSRARGQRIRRLQGKEKAAELNAVHASNSNNDAITLAADS